MRAEGFLNSQRPFGLVLTALISMSTLVLYYYMQVGISPVIESATKGLCPTSEDPAFVLSGLTVSISILLSAPVCTAIVLLFAKSRRGISATDYIALNRTSAKGIAAWILLTAGVMVMFELFSRALQRPPAPVFMIELYESACYLPALYAAVCFAGPVFEEVLFRGFVFSGVEGSGLGTWGAVVVTSLYWSLIHMQYDGLDMLNLFVLGLLLGAARARTRSLYAPLAMHVFNNTAALINTAIVLRG